MTKRIKINRNKTEKYCSLCGNWLPRDLEHFSTDVYRVDGFSYACRKCILKQHREIENKRDAGIERSIKTELEHSIQDLRNIESMVGNLFQ